jgi:hypothetical protein
MRYLSNSKIIITCIVLALTISNAFAQEAETKAIDFKLKLGYHDFVLPYLFAGDVAPGDGYLLHVADLALLKVELDSFQDTLNESQEFFKKECKRSLEKCQEDSHDRYKLIIDENEILKIKLVDKTRLYEAQKNKTLIYSIASAVIGGALVGVTIKILDP